MKGWKSSREISHHLYNPGISHTLTATLSYIDLISSSELGTLISHPIKAHRLFFSMKTSTVVAFKFLQRCRQHPRTDEKWEKHLPLRKQDVPTHSCPEQNQITKQNSVFPKHNMGQLEALVATQSCFNLFSTCFQVKQAFLQSHSQDEERLCFDKKKYVHFKRPAISLIIRHQECLISAGVHLFYVLIRQRNGIFIPQFCTECILKFGLICTSVNNNLH